MGYKALHGCGGRDAVAARWPWELAPPGPQPALPEPCGSAGPGAGTGPSSKTPTTLPSSHQLLVTAKPTGKHKQKMWLHLKQASALLGKGS